MPQPSPSPAAAVSPPPPPPPTQPPQATPPQPPPQQQQSTTLPLGEAHTLLTSLTAFLTVSIHTVLYYRRIYPPATFLSVRAFNLAVHQNRHPKVYAWIRDAVDAVATQLAAGTVERVAVVIHAPPSPSPPPPPPPAPRASDAATTAAAAPPPPPRRSPGSSSRSSGQPVLERWVFDLSHIPPWPGGAEAMRAFESVQQQRQEDEAAAGEEGEEGEEGGDDEAVVAAAAGGESGGEGENHQQAVINWVDVNEQLRGVVRRLAHAGEKLAPLPEGCTFTVALELRDESEAPIGHPQPWIPSGPEVQRSRLQPACKAKGMGDAGTTTTTTTTTTPVRSMEAGPLFLECWVEQGKSSDSLAKNNTTAVDPITTGRETPVKAR